MEPYPKKKSRRQLRGVGGNTFGKKSLERFDKNIEAGRSVKSFNKKKSQQIIIPERK